ncbi:MAG: hypothetical protein IPP93_03590 [Chitinophagaceae bacterium]|nr:hypothetical protein [Chitinophagaceae bacterium]
MKTWNLHTVKDTTTHFNPANIISYLLSLYFLPASCHLHPVKAVPTQFYLLKMKPQLFSVDLLPATCHLLPASCI